MVQFSQYSDSLRVWELIPVGGEIFRSSPNPAFYTILTVSLPSEKGKVRDVDYPCPYTATLENE